MQGMYSTQRLKQVLNVTTMVMQQISDTPPVVFYVEDLYTTSSGFGGLVVSMLASGTHDRGFTPGRIFRAKNSSACLPSEGK
jgi:hypothetical protein